MTRAVPEWRGKTPDTKVPPRVRLRIFERDGGRCHISGRKIAAGEPWELDHVIALVNGGEHRESNLAPALRDKHKVKTAADVAQKSSERAIRGKHTGALAKPSTLRSAGFPKREPQRRASSPLTKTMPARRMT